MAIRVLPYGPCVSRPIDASDLQADHMRWESQFPGELHEHIPLWDPIEIRLLRVDKTQARWLAIDHGSIGVFGEEQLLGFKWRSTRIEVVILLSAVVDLTSDEPSPDIGLNGIAFVAKHPPTTNDLGLRVRLSSLQIRDLPNFVVKICELFTDSRSH